MMEKIAVTYDELGLRNTDSDDEIQDKVSDWLSDSTGFCHYGFSWYRTKQQIVVTHVDWDKSE